MNRAASMLPAGRRAHYLVGLVTGIALASALGAHWVKGIRGSFDGECPRVAMRSGVEVGKLLLVCESLRSTLR